MTETPGARDRRLRTTSTAYRISQHLLTAIATGCRCAVPAPCVNRSSRGGVLVCQICGYVVAPRERGR